MIWLELAVAAFGGGLIATVLDAWIAHLRAFETARLQVLDDLDSINALSETIKKFGDRLEPAELERMRYPTRTWSANRAVMVTRLERNDPALLNRMSSLFAVLALTPLTGTIENDLRDGLENAYKALRAATLGRVEGVFVYGPSYAVRRRRPPYRVLDPKTAAQITALPPD
jgi:hypothetical protein